MSQPALEQLFSPQLQQLLSSQKILPLEQWQPKFCGEMDLVIKANGEWWHEGKPIRRQKLIDLFAKVLWRENDEYFLKTPVEKIKIQVEDAPLQVIAADTVILDGLTYLQLRTQTQDIVIVDDAHPIFIRTYQQEQRPYVHVRFGLNALIQRAAFYHLVQLGELGEMDGETCLKLTSGNHDFCLKMA